MIIVRKHIAIFLYVVFFFPITFQPAHILWHHDHSDECGHHTCHREIVDKDSHSNTYSLSEHEEECPICEYHFSIVDIPEISLYHSIVPVFNRLLDELATQQQYKQVFSDKTPRAPPVLIS